MKISQAARIILGLLTLWVLIYPFIFGVAWILFIIFVSAPQNQTSTAAYTIPFFLLPFFVLFFASVFIQVGLQAFYLVHLIVNKAGNDVVKAILGVGIFLFTYLALPIYYFVYLLPDQPPSWALASTMDKPSATRPPDTQPLPPAS